jgi:hypothetical protein
MGSTNVKSYQFDEVKCPDTKRNEQLEDLVIIIMALSY